MAEIPDYPLVASALDGSELLLGYRDGKTVSIPASKIVADVEDQTIELNLRAAGVDTHLTTLDQHGAAVDTHLATLDQHAAAIDTHLTTLDQRGAAVDTHLATLDQRAEAAATAVQAYAAQTQAEASEQACDYFIDPTSGVDTRDGRTKATAWKTDAPFNALSKVARDNSVIGLPRGSFGPPLVFSGDYLRVVAFGDPTLSDPQLSGALPLVRTAWTNEGSGIFRQDVTGALADAKNIANVSSYDPVTRYFEPIQLYTTRAALAAAPNGAAVIGWGTANLTVYLKPQDGDPATNGHIYQVDNGLPLQINGLAPVVEGITALNPGHQDGGIQLEGIGAAVRKCSLINGSRHDALIAPGGVIEDNYFGGGRNDFEFGVGGGNTLVVFAPMSLAGQSITLRRNVHDSRGQPAVAGPYWHAGGDNLRPLSALLEDETFVSLNVCIGGSPEPVEGIICQRPVFRTAPGGQVCGAFSLSSVQTYSPSGEINSWTADNGADQGVYDADLDVPSLGNGRAGFFFMQGNDHPTRANIVVRRGEFRFNPYYPLGAGPNAAIASLSHGDFDASDVRFVTKGTVLGHKVFYGWDLADGNVKGGGNTYPYGVKFRRNGVQYETLATAQAAGFEAGSVTQQPPAPTVTSLFDVPDGTVLADVPGWTLMGGPAGGMIVQNGRVRATGNPFVAYKRGDLPTAGGFVQFMPTVNSSYNYACTHIKDELNFVGIFLGGDSRLIGMEVSNGGLSQFMNPSRVIANGEDVRVVTRMTDLATSLYGFWLFAGDEMIYFVERELPNFAGITAAGLAANSPAPVGFVDNFRMGPL